MPKRIMFSFSAEDQTPLIFQSYSFSGSKTQHCSKKILPLFSFSSGLQQLCGYQHHYQACATMTCPKGKIKFKWYLLDQKGCWEANRQSNSAPPLTLSQLINANCQLQLLRHHRRFFVVCFLVCLLNSHLLPLTLNLPLSTWQRSLIAGGFQTCY